MLCRSKSGAETSRSCFANPSFLIHIAVFVNTSLTWIRRKVFRNVFFASTSSKGTKWVPFLHLHSKSLVVVVWCHFLFWKQANVYLKKEEKFNNKLCGTHSNFSETIAWRSFERSFILHLEGWIRQQFCGNPSQLNVLNCLWKSGTHFCWFISNLPFVWRNSFTTLTHKPIFTFLKI